MGKVLFFPVLPPPYRIPGKSGLIFKNSLTLYPLSIQSLFNLESEGKIYNILSNGDKKNLNTVKPTGIFESLNSKFLPPLHRWTWCSYSCLYFQESKSKGKIKVAHLCPPIHPYFCFSAHNWFSNFCWKSLNSIISSCCFDSFPLLNTFIFWISQEWKVCNFSTGRKCQKNPVC